VSSDNRIIYKIGFSTNSVEERIANAEHEPTYLMAPVEIVATYKVVNLHSQKFEDLVMPHTLTAWWSIILAQYWR